MTDNPSKTETTQPPSDGPLAALTKKADDFSNQTGRIFDDELVKVERRLKIFGEDQEKALGDYLKENRSTLDGFVTKLRNPVEKATGDLRANIPAWVKQAEQSFEGYAGKLNKTMEQERIQLQEYRAAHAKEIEQLQAATRDLRGSSLFGMFTMAMVMFCGFCLGAAFGFPPWW